MLSPYRRCTAMASSVISSKMSAFQYHCRPAGKSPSKALCRTANGIGWRPTSNGEPNSRTGASTSSAPSCAPE